MAYQFLQNPEVFKGKKVLVRFDFNVPLDSHQKILDSSRIDKALKTIEFLRKSEAKSITMMSHLGRPKGIESKFSLAPVAEYLSHKLDSEVIMSESAIDCGVKDLLALDSTKLVLLENLRFHPEEKAGDSDFAFKLSQYGDIYINDAFGVCHRADASVYSILKYFPHKAFAGKLLEAEIKELGHLIDAPQKPSMALIGGAKVSDKIKIIEKLLPKVQKILIGGAMAYPFLKEQGHQVGKSLCSEEDQTLAKSLLKQDRGGKIVLPIDHMIAQDLQSNEAMATDDVNIAENFMGLDIGPKTIERFQSVLSEAKTIFWNGPMGLFENKAFSKGTMGLADFLSQSNSYTLVGGGDSVSAIKTAGLEDKFSHISTGGGASLEFIEKDGNLPALKALKLGL